MNIHSFLDLNTETFTHILVSEADGVCAVIDPVLDFDQKSGEFSQLGADRIISFIRDHQLTLKYIIETHAHADHLSSAPYIKQQLGGQIVIGQKIDEVQKTFKTVFNLSDLATDGSQFDILTDEGTTLMLGRITITAMHVPGHTPADMAYQADDGERLVVFVGDTIFAPDVGTARCDFPNGSAKNLYHSIERILALPDETQLYLCHDYPPKGRDYTPKTTVGEQKRHNIHVKNGISQDDFVKMRNARDKTLAVPRLILPSVQVNINAGELPQPEDNGVRYLKLPLHPL
ncbi:MBL fold metallo-hydrolase [Moraxella nasovis]|uniref:MBL fold metallo-hydrolase n=1 Tax=Moraxella nasovis TaxID=2904121 RepID=UPI001F611A48|nr:MBL fold metallo-hydrolase [Moraxella nasovis]UNU72876.1 MBL fold metallo-hydrolase [Moraxella nasovis]